MPLSLDEARYELALANRIIATEGVLDFVLTIRDETHRCKQQSMLKRQPETKRSEIPKQIAE